MEIMIILAVALIFVGPDQLPKVARQIGKGVRQVRGAMGKVDDEMRRAVREASAEFDDDGERIEPRTPVPHDGPTPPPVAPADGAATPPSLLKPAAPPIAAPPTANVVATDANAPPKERDWSQVGKAPVAGTVPAPNRIASAIPARPVTEAPADPTFVPVADTAVAPAPAPAIVLEKPSDPASPT